MVVAVAKMREGTRVEQEQAAVACELVGAAPRAPREADTDNPTRGDAGAGAGRTRTYVGLDGCTGNTATASCSYALAIGENDGGAM